MKIHPAAPNTLEWLQARCGIPTASELNHLVSPTGKVRTGEMPRSYIHRKLAEKWLGSPIASFQSIDMEVGTIVEKEAIPAYELEFNVKIRRVGLVLTDNDRFGASPDGLIGDTAGIEIKCGRADTHVGYVLGNCVPDEHWLQVQGGMFATGLPEWVFMSHHRKMPPLIVRVQRDDEIQEQIAIALDAFYEAFNDGWERMVKLNDGPPKNPTFQYTPKPKPGFVPTTDDIPT